MLTQPRARHAQPSVHPLGKPRPEGQVAAIEVAKLAQPRPETLDVEGCGTCRQWRQNPDERAAVRRLLRTHGKGPRGRRPTEQRYELAPPHVGHWGSFLPGMTISDRR